MRFHLAGLPHTDLDQSPPICAYSAKAAKFITMMEARGHEVLVYWGQDTPNPDGSDQPYWPEDWSEHNARIRVAIEATLQRDDIVLLSGGWSQRELLDLPVLVCEYGIGYEATCAKYRVFESYAWMHYIYGKNREGDGSFFDDVIPNPVDPDEFHLDHPDDYFLFVGRVVTRKGLQVAAEATEALNARLVVAGPLSAEVDLTQWDHVTHVGTVDSHVRSDLMARARALFAPTLYVEPWGGVTIEALASGCPVICTDWGAFTETIQNGANGFRCRMLADFIEAGHLVSELDRDRIRSTAVVKYGLEPVSRRYERYFERLLTLHGEGWYANTKPEAA